MRNHILSLALEEDYPIWTLIENTSFSQSEDGFEHLITLLLNILKLEFKEAKIFWIVNKGDDNLTFPDGLNLIVVDSSSSDISVGNIQYINSQQVDREYSFQEI